MGKDRLNSPEMRAARKRIQCPYDQLVGRPALLVLLERMALVAIDDAASRITDDLFCNVQGDVAERLVLFRDSDADAKDLGGLCWSSVKNRIVKEFEEILDAAIKRR